MKKPVNGNKERYSILILASLADSNVIKFYSLMYVPKY